MNSEKKKIISLPFSETIRRSLTYVFTNMDIVLKVSAIWFIILIYEAAAGFPSLCNINNSCSNNNIAQNISVILLSLASIAVSIAFIRIIILKTPVKYFSFAFGLREIKYFLYNLFLVLIYGLSSFFIIYGLSYLGQKLGFPEWYFNLMLFIPLFIIIYCSRFYLIFPGVAVDDKEMGILDSFKLTLGNANKIFWGMVFMMLPIALSLIALAYLFRFIGGEQYWVVKLIFVAIAMFLSFLDACLKGAYYAHLYQYFVFYKNKQATEAEAEKTEK